MGKNDNTLNKRLKKLRKESRLTQEQLANYLEIDQSMVTKLENGTRTLSTEIVDKICSLFCCTEEYLMGERDEYIPLNFAFRSNSIQADDLLSIAVINKIAMNLRFMNEMIGDE